MTAAESARRPTPLDSGPATPPGPRPGATRRAGSAASPASPWPSTIAPRPCRSATRVARPPPRGSSPPTRRGPWACDTCRAVGSIRGRVIRPDHPADVRPPPALARPGPGPPALPLGPRRPRFPGRLVCHAVEPVADLLPWHDRRRPPGEDEEGRLKGVLGIVVVSEDPAADAPDHRAVALHQGFEERHPRRRATKPVQELSVRQPDERPRPEKRLYVSAVPHSHRCPSPRRPFCRPRSASKRLLPARGRLHTLFLPAAGFLTEPSCDRRWRLCPGKTSGLLERVADPARPPVSQACPGHANPDASPFTAWLSSAFVATPSWPLRCPRRGRAPLPFRHPGGNKGQQEGNRRGPFGADKCPSWLVGQEPPCCSPGTICVNQGLRMPPVSVRRTGQQGIRSSRNTFSRLFFPLHPPTGDPIAARSHGRTATTPEPAGPPDGRPHSAQQPRQDHTRETGSNRSSRPAAIQPGLRYLLSRERGHVEGRGSGPGLLLRTDSIVYRDRRLFPTRHRRRRPSLLIEVPYDPL